MTCRINYSRNLIIRHSMGFVILVWSINTFWMAADSKATHICDFSSFSIWRMNKLLLYYVFHCLESYNSILKLNQRLNVENKEKASSSAALVLVETATFTQKKFLEKLKFHFLESARHPEGFCRHDSHFSLTSLNWMDGVQAICLTCQKYELIKII